MERLLREGRYERSIDGEREGVRVIGGKERIRKGGREGGEGVELLKGKEFERKKV